MKVKTALKAGSDKNVEIISYTFGTRSPYDISTGHTSTTTQSR